MVPLTASAMWSTANAIEPQNVMMTRIAPMAHLGMVVSRTAKQTADTLGLPVRCLFRCLSEVVLLDFREEL